MNVSEENLGEYISEFFETLHGVSNKFLPKEHIPKLFHLALLPAKITGYVSTQYGVAIEYLPAKETTIETKRSSQRIEDLVFGAPSRLKSRGPLLIFKNSPNIEFKNINFADAVPFRVEGQDASVTIVNMLVDCKRLNWERKIHYAEVYGDRRLTTWSKEAAQNKAKDEVLAALLDIQQATSRNLTLPEYIQSFKERTVLVLGSYNEAGMQRLYSIASHLENLGYEPILIKDVPDFEYYDIPQKVVAIGAVSRFIVIDDSSPSGHLYETNLCISNKWVTVILRQNNKGSSWMTAGASITSNVILECEYTDESLLTPLSESTQWAEEKLKELKEKFTKIFPWRYENI